MAPRAASYTGIRLRHRDGEIPEDFDAIYSFDVIEHIDDPFSFLAEMEKHAALVVVNFLEEDPHDTSLQSSSSDREASRSRRRTGIVRYRLFHGRSHLVAYRSSLSSNQKRFASTVQRRLGRFLR